MKTIRVATFNGLMAELRDEFGKGKVFLAEIHSDGDMVEGLYEPSSGAVYVDPVPNVVDTLLHELLHRRYPRWGERRVSDTAHRLVTAMSDAERRLWYQAWKRAAKKTKRPVRVETC